MEIKEEWISYNLVFLLFFFFNITVQKVDMVQKGWWPKLKAKN